MPVAKKWSIDQLMDACRRYIKKTNRRITFEYACIDRVNVLDKYAVELAERLKGMLCHVNLIPINPISEESFKAVENVQLNKFFDILKNKENDINKKMEFNTNNIEQILELIKQRKKKVEITKKYLEEKIS